MSFAVELANVLLDNGLDTTVHTMLEVFSFCSNGCSNECSIGGLLPNHPGRAF